jgi:hypothetical protein
MTSKDFFKEVKLEWCASEQQDKPLLNDMMKFAKLYHKEQLILSGVSNCALTPKDLIEFNKWTQSKMYSHRLYVVPKDLTDFYLENKANIIENNKKHCY